MQRQTKSIKIEHPDQLKLQLLEWSKQFKQVFWLDSNDYEQDSYSQFDALLAVDASRTLSVSYTDAFAKLEAFQKEVDDWIFGYLSYDLKNTIENLESNNLDELAFPDLYFFQPQKIIILKGDRLELLYTKSVAKSFNEDLQDILAIKPSDNRPKVAPKRIKLRLNKDAYKNKVRELLYHINRGDIYEANFCQEFYALGALDPWYTFKQLNTISQPPFATFLRLEDNYLCSASPERFLCRRGNKLITQPIKGTAPRGKDNVADAAFKKALTSDPKERAENIMIVDLVRNDLSRVAQKGSVTVTELCRVYPFKQVHQMISTVSATVKTSIDIAQLLEATFPMGSMTGAPKIRAMQLIEELEVNKRGLYSGAVGYIKPDGDFDFNVVIRSILSVSYTHLTLPTIYSV